MKNLCYLLRVTVMVIFVTFFISKTNASDLVEVLPLTDDVIMLHFDDGWIDYAGYHEDPDTDVLYHFPLNTTNAQNAGSYTISSLDDANYSGGVQPDSVGRKSKGTDFQGGCHNWIGRCDNEVIFDHWLLLRLPNKMVPGKTYTVTVGSLADNVNEVTFTYDIFNIRSDAVHVNQIGFVPSSKKKFAYVSFWAGDWGPMDLSAYNGNTFHVVRVSDETSVFTGTLVQQHSRYDADIAYDIWNDSKFSNFIGADVYECDFTAFSDTGEYVIAVEGLGCSYPFRIHEDVYREAFNTTARGVFHQRAGVAQTSPYSEWNHPVDHKPTVNGNTINYTTTRWMDMASENGDEATATSNITGAINNTWGWYHDAGDWDGYAHHDRVPRTLMTVYEMAPKNFSDGELNIPESGNGIPDILDEATWLINYFKRNVGPTGGFYGDRIHGNWDSKSGDGLPSWEDNRTWIVYGEEPRTTYKVAGMCAQLAYCYMLAQERSTSDLTDSIAGLMATAVNAYNWANANLLAGDDDIVKNERLYASAWLYKTTGMTSYQTQFIADTTHEDFGKQKWGKWAYVTISDTTTGLNTGLQAELHSNALGYANTQVMTALDYGRSMRMAGNWWMPITIGQPTTPWTLPAIVAYEISGLQKYIDACYTYCDYMLGGNGDNMCWVTGLGDEHPLQILHLDSWYDSKDEVIPGIVPYGATMMDDWTATGPYDSDYNLLYGLYPDWREWPIHEKFVNDRFTVMSNEYTVHQNVAPAAGSYGYLCAEKNPVTVSITAPSLNQVFPTNPTISVTADAADELGSITKVIFYANGTQIGQRFAFPWSINWSPSSNGQYDLVAEAHGNGNKEFSDPVRVFVGNASPQVSILSPQDGDFLCLSCNDDIVVDAFDPDGTIDSVQIFDGAVQIGTMTSAPFNYSLAGLSSGAHSITAKAYDNAGVSSTSTPVGITVGTQERTPYLGVVQQIPGMIQPEKFDNGGEGCAYHDDLTRKGDTVRVTPEMVDLQVTGGTDTIIGWTSDNEWLKLSVNVGVTGLYDVVIRWASGGAGGTMHLEMDGVDVTGSIALGNTGFWDIWSTLTVNDVSLTSGNHTLTVYFETGGYNLDEIEFISQTAYKPVTGVSVNPTSINLDKGNTSQVNETVSPADATDKSVTWTTDDASVATVDATGLVTAVGDGSCTITCTTNDGGHTATTTVNVNVPVTGITVLPESITINKGSNTTLSASIQPSDASDLSISWVSSDETVATVNASGVVTAVDAGTATITATTNDGGFTDNCAVTVVIPATGVTVTPATASINVGETVQLNETVEPANATNNNVNWTSSDDTKATVDANGLVTGQSGGTATITVTTLDGGHQATADITITVPVTSVSVNPATMNLLKGETGTIIPTVLPANATDKSVSWSTDDSGIATVDASGVVTAVGGGTCIITCTTNDGAKTATTDVNVTVPVDGVSLSPATVSVDKGNTTTLTATVSPADATNQGVSWSSSNPGIASVDASGVVTGVSGGSCTITVTTNDGSYPATCNVTVNVPVSNVAVTPDKDTLVIGETKTLVATVSPTDASDKSVTWSSSNNSVATVISGGLVEGIAEGTAIITVTTNDGSLTATSEIVVKIGTKPVTGVSLNESAITLNRAATQQLIASVAPSDASDKSVTWSSDNTAAATVDGNGLVTAVEEGLATITVTTNDGGFTATCNITVVNPVTNVTVAPTSLDLDVGSTATLTETISPADATDQSVTWASSNVSAATVDASGIVTGIAEGSATITVTTNDGGYTASCNVNVTQWVESISVTPTTANLQPGETVQLSESITPSNATDQTVTWTTSDNGIASVNPSGLVTAIADGVATITVTTNDGSFQATSSITVGTPVSGVSVDVATLELTPGQDSTITATISPSNATNKNVSWSSDDVSVATVDENGVVTAVGGGSCVITVTTEDGNLTATTGVTVIVPVQSISVSPTTASLQPTEAQSLSVSFTPSDASNKAVTFTSSDPAVATVDASGLITAVDGGTCTITATSDDGNHEASCAVTVTVDVDGVTLDKTTLSMASGTNSQLTATVSPANATDKSVTWSSSDAATVSVDTDGVLTANTSGSATITVTTNDGNFTATCDVTVSSEVTGVSLDKNNLSLDPGATSQLTATVSPSDAADKSVTWSSSSPAIASVDQNGLVTAQSGGTATITVETNDGGFTDNCIVNVSTPVTGVSLDNQTLNIGIGLTSQLTATIEPSGADNKNVSWSSTDASIATVSATGLVTAVSEGTAHVIVETEEGAFTDSCEVIILADDIQVKEENQIVLFPVPCEDFLEVRTNLVYNKVVITNTLGQTMMILEQDMESIKVSNLEKGVYFINLYQDDEKVSDASFVKL